MSGFEKIKIGIIASTTGTNSKVSNGMLDSARCMVERKYGWLEKKGISLELVIKDDNSDPLSAISKLKELVDDGCVAIIAPTDSMSVREILISGVSENVPIFSTIASSSFLSGLDSNNFFRFTTPDCIRAKMLVSYVKGLYPSSTVYIATLEGAEFSYGQQLKKDVINALEKNKMKWISFDYSHDVEVAQKPNNNEPLIVCGPSSSIVSLAKSFRADYINSQIFAFGSNTNLLDDSLVNTIVVCDLDRDDVNPIVSNEIDHFSVKFCENSNPDLSTMNAVSTLCNILSENANFFATSELSSKRHKLLNILKSTTHHKALLGQISFGKSGEMAGNENISILRVTKNKGAFTFCSLKRDEKAILQDNHWWKGRVGIFGAIASIVSLIIVIIVESSNK